MFETVTWLVVMATEERSGCQAEGWQLHPSVACDCLERTHSAQGAGVMGVTALPRWLGTLCVSPAQGSLCVSRLEIVPAGGDLPLESLLDSGWRLPDLRVSVTGLKSISISSVGWARGP